MSFVNTFVRAGYHQYRNIYRKAKGEPLLVAPLNGMTLDEDDVALAESWLNKRGQWYAPELAQQYEAEFASWNGSAYAAAFMGGRVALSAIIYALDLQPGDEVIIPGYTCVVVPNAFSFAGVQVLYSDIELDTFGLDASALPSKISPRTKAIMIQHLYGLVCRDYEEIITIAKQHGLFIIEDCAHSLGAAYKGRKVGNFGDAAFYSTERSKVMTTIQGGIAVTNDDTIAARINEYASRASLPDQEWIQTQLHNVSLTYVQAKDPHRWWRSDWNSLRYNNQFLISTTQEEMRGTQPSHYGRKMPAPIAALGLNQLRKLETYNERRRHTAKRWDQWCEENDYNKPLIMRESEPVYLRYPVLVEQEKKRDRSWARRELGVELGVWFVSNAHPASREVAGCPNSDTAVRRCINFPTIIETE